MAMPPEKRKDYLERLIQGLEQAVENTKAEIPYYRPDDLQLKYAKKFLSAVEENLAKSREELEAILAAENKGE